MLLLIARPPMPDQPYWPGRRLLAAIDAAAWPLLWVMWFSRMPLPTGVVGLLIMAVAMVFALRRVHQAVGCNHRYRFTTWRWGRLLAILLVIGWALKLAVAM